MFQTILVLNILKIHLKIYKNRSKSFKNSYVSVLVDNVDKKEISDKVKCLEEKGISFVKIKRTQQLKMIATKRNK